MINCIISLSFIKLNKKNNNMHEIDSNLSTNFFASEKVDSSSPLIGTKPESSIDSEALKDTQQVFRNKGSFRKFLSERSTRTFKNNKEISLPSLGSPIPLLKVAQNLNSAGLRYNALGELQKALLCYNKALEIREAFYKNQPHPNMATSLNNVGTACHALGETRLALSYYERALTMCRALYKEQPDALVLTLNNVGFAHATLGEAQKSLSYYEEALKLCKGLYKGQPHPNLALSLSNMGGAYNALGERQKSLSCGKEALEVRRKLYKDQPHHPDLANSLNNVGTAYTALGERQKGLSYYKEALAIRKILYKERPHLSLAISLNNVGATYNALGNHRLALDHCKQAFQMGCEVYKRAHPHLVLCLKNTIDILSKMNDSSVIKTTQKELYPLCVKTLGENHEQTQLLMNIEKRSSFLPSFL